MKREFDIIRDTFYFNNQVYSSKFFEKQPRFFKKQTCLDLHPKNVKWRSKKSKIIAFQLFGFFRVLPSLSTRIFASIFGLLTANLQRINTDGRSSIRWSLRLSARVILTSVKLVKSTQLCTPQRQQNFLILSNQEL